MPRCLSLNTCLWSIHECNIPYIIPYKYIGLYTLYYSRNCTVWLKFATPRHAAIYSMSHNYCSSSPWIPYRYIIYDVSTPIASVHHTRPERVHSWLFSFAIPHQLYPGYTRYRTHRGMQYTAGCISYVLYHIRYRRGLKHFHTLIYTKCRKKGGCISYATIPDTALIWQH